MIEYDKFKILNMSSFNGGYRKKGGWTMLKRLLVMFFVFTIAGAVMAAQCAAITKKGTQCKRQASPDSSYCWQHGGTTKAQRAAGIQPKDAPAKQAENGYQQCKATTQKGTQCSRRAQEGSIYCWQHAEKAGEQKKVTQAATTRQNTETAQQVKTPSQVGDGQCAATTQSGERCSRKAKEGSRYCWQHAEKAGEQTKEAKTSTPQKKTETAQQAKTPSQVGDGQCTAITKSGERCSRKAKAGSDRCWQHED
ncbi:hypothetical protein J6T93_03210 [bacterium]|nr:hypothetical protein [bacterium]